MANKLYEESHIQNIANAIRGKTGKSDLLDVSEMAGEISNISAGLDTSDATVTANDLAEGVVAYGSNGRIVGSVKTVDSGWIRDVNENTTVSSGSITNDGVTTKLIKSKYKFTSNNLFRSGSFVEVGVNVNEFGNATAADVLEGRTFTSADGLKVVGTGTLKMFTWEKYSVIDGTTSEAYSQQAIENKYGTKLSSTLITLYSSGSFDADTGVYTLSGSTIMAWGNVYSNKTYETYPYYYVDDAHTKIAKIVSMTPPKVGAVVQNYGVNYTEYYSLKNEQGVVKGSYIEDVTSTYSHEYPADGYQDGYWYVLKEISTPKLQDKVITENGTYQADSGYDALRSVTVEVASSLEGLENGYDVMFYDENNDGLAFYSVRQGLYVDKPQYNCKRWVTADGVVVELPLQPTSDMQLYASNNTYARILYENYGVDMVEYPYLAIRVDNASYSSLSEVVIYFAKSISESSLKDIIYGGAVQINPKITDLEVENVVDVVISNISGVSRTSTSESLWNMANIYYYTNFDYSFTKATLYRLDE